MGEIDFTRYDSSKPIREITYEALKDAIIAGDILPGERIVESSFATKLNISRTPIREALRKLEQDGLVEYTPRKGVIVRSLEESDINEIYTIREVLEALALEKALDRITVDDISELRQILEEIDNCVLEGDINTASKHSREIHLKIYQFSGMERLVILLNTLDEYMDRFSYMSLSDDERRKAAAQEHRQLVDALEAGKLDAVLKISASHLRGARKNCIIAYETRKQESLANKDRQDQHEDS